MNIKLQNIQTNTHGLFVYYSFIKSDGQPGFDHNQPSITEASFVLQLRLPKENTGDLIEYDLYDYMEQFNLKTLITDPIQTPGKIVLWSTLNVFSEYCIVTETTGTTPAYHFCSISKSYDSVNKHFEYVISGPSVGMNGCSKIYLITDSIELPISLGDGPLTAQLKIHTYSSEIINLFNLQRLTTAIIELENKLNSYCDDAVLIKLAYLKLKYQCILQNLNINNLDKAKQILKTI